MSQETQQALSLEVPELVRAIEALSEAQVDALPFGVVRLDEECNVLGFSKAEAVQSGFERLRAMGRGFFTEVAPCLDTPGFLERLGRARRRGTLDLRFEHVGDFSDPTRLLDVRVVSASGGGFWVFLHRP
jgi:photoactive yellow protein